MRTVTGKQQIAKATQTLREQGHPQVKLSRDQAMIIRFMVVNKVLPQKEIQALFGISYNLIYRIKNNISYSDQNPTWQKRELFLSNKG
jgi:DNA invertase Pin-like site-specific DNA recombinase